MPASNMPQTYCPCPRPILKRSSTTPHQHEYAVSLTRDESGQLLAIDPSILSPLVRFPPSPTLTRTFKTHSPSTYDRSPIVVSPNQCSLPERGCPGRTYLPGAPSATSSSSSSHRLSTSSRGYTGKHLHPRARMDVQASYPYEDEDDEDNDLTPKATPTAYFHPLPPLIPDLSSSSESEESDGATSPPSADASLEFSTLCISPISSRQSSFLPHPRTYPPSNSNPSTSPTTPTSSNSSSPRPIPSSSSNSRRHLSPTRPKRTRGHPPITSSSPPSASAAASGDVLVSPLEPRYKTFSEKSMLNGCSLPVPDMGCFGGF
ncbi:unnamed protein product [Somion occarium]|uniref:Uncharacterized protein n=1 Tax=Somion occarium TaxID=3059160 RepID=A0ABP1CV53_9APHY